MTPTPRTDANESVTCKGGDPCIAPDFARQLERENAELLVALEGMMSAFDCLPCDPFEFCPDAWSAAKSAIRKSERRSEVI